jgi:hypothetical protein
MMELTTGVVFLMSSLYGSGQPAQNIQVTADPATVPAKEVTATVDSKTIGSNPKVVEAYLRKAYANEPILVDIARCESNFKQFDDQGNIIRGRVNNGDVGVMQINEKYHADMAKKLNFDLYSLEGNTAYAKHLYEEQGTQPWASSQKCWGDTVASSVK